MSCNGMTELLRSINPYNNEEQMWSDIRKIAKTSPALQEQLDKVLAIYILIKPNV